MLRFLSIARLAIIDAVTVEFGPGLSVLTGETGAGKSIVVGAVELLLGGRASSELVRTGEDTAEVEAVFVTPEGRELTVRREVSSTGRSRASVDGAVVTNATLREVTSPLVDLHGQHDHQALLDAEAHLALLDRFGGLDSLVADTARAFDAWKTTRDALDASHLDDRERRARLDLLEFQLAEIERIGPRAGEDEELQATRRVLLNADRLHRLCSEAYLDLYDGEGAALEKLSRVWKRMEELAILDPRFAGYEISREAVVAHLQELVYALREHTTHIDASPERLQAVEDRLAALERVKRRHGPSLDDVLRRCAQLVAEREALASSAGRVEELTRRLEQQRAAFLDTARALARARRTAAARFSSELSAELAELAMAGARCDLHFDDDELPDTRWSRRGIDAGELFLSANVGEVPRPLARIASGGELSRVMLGLKTLASTDLPGKTLIFDEVDAGIGGGAADAVGARLRRLGAQFQVLCITHLPQVAAHAHAQYRVAKDVSRGRTTTSVERLSRTERVEEVARMMGGDARTRSVLAGARDLLDARAKDEQNTKGESESPAPGGGTTLDAPRRK